MAACFHERGGRPYQVAVTAEGMGENSRTAEQQEATRRRKVVINLESKSSKFKNHDESHSGMQSAVRTESDGGCARAHHPPVHSLQPVLEVREVV